MIHEEWRLLRLIASILGIIAVLNVAILGTCVIEGFLLLALLLPSFVNEAIFALALTIISGILLFFGSFSIYKQHAIRGAIFNLAAWAITMFICFWGVLVWKFPSLVQMGLTSIVLLVPSLTSGIIGILIFYMERSTA